MSPRPHRPTVRPAEVGANPAVMLVCPCGWSQVWRAFDPTPTELLEAEVAHRSKAVRS